MKSLDGRLLSRRQILAGKCNRPTILYVGCQRGGMGARDAGGGVGVGSRTIAGGSGCGVSGTDDPTSTLSGLAGCFVQPICCIHLAIVSLVSGDQPSSEAFVAIICLVV